VPAPSNTRVLLARHGQTAYNLQRRFQGQLPVGLDDTGRSQSAQLAQRVSRCGLRALWCSTLLRARQTADVVSAATGLALREDARLMETDAGDWTDLLFSDVQARWPEQFAAFLAGDPGFSFPGGESFAQQERRVAEALADVEAGPLPALVVCHGMVIRAARSLRTGSWERYAQRVANGAVVALDAPPGEPPQRPGADAQAVTPAS
jgi:broad specificity phosphatase PhoE